MSLSVGINVGHKRNREISIVNRVLDNGNLSDYGQTSLLSHARIVSTFFLWMSRRADNVLLRYARRVNH